MKSSRPPRRIAVAVAVLLGCAACPALAQDTPAPAPPAQPPRPAETSAVDAARDYTRRMKSDQPAGAIRTYWDMDAMLEGMFGEHLRRHSDKERAEMQRLLLTFVETVYANRDIAQAMKQAEFEEFSSDEDKQRETTTVRFNVRIQDKVIPNALQMKQADGKWRIIDAGANGRMMVPNLRSQYETQAQRVTPLEYIKMMTTQGPAAKGKEGGARQQ